MGELQAWLQAGWQLFCWVNERVSQREPAPLCMCTWWWQSPCQSLLVWSSQIQPVRGPGTGSSHSLVLITCLSSLPPPPLRNGSIVVDYLAILELPFSPQLKSQYKKVGEQLQKASQDLDTCHSGQSELGLKGQRQRAPTPVWGPPVAQGQSWGCFCQAGRRGHGSTSG